MRSLLIGRFQPFHNGHAELVKYAIDNYEEIVISIGSAYDSYTLRNPFTAGERYLMIQMALDEIGISQYYIVPVPDINRYSIYASHVAEISPKFDVVLSNNIIIKEIFEKDGFKVEGTPMFKRDIYSGTEIRRRIAAGEEWRQFVPDVVTQVIKEIKGEERIKKLSNTC
jgi:nicotinamide-nucleotide adenylyltransferase